MCHCYNNLTRCGGTMSRDFNSYGPEEYMLRNAGPGTYKIDCKVVQTNRGTSTQNVCVNCKIFSNFGRKEQTEKMILLQIPCPTGSGKTYSLASLTI